MRKYTEQFPPAILDIEASGFGQDSYPIEIGCICSDGSRFCNLIKPLPDWTHWSDSAEKAHGITKHTLLQLGKSPLELTRELNQRLGGMTVYSDGWVVDKPWLMKLFFAVGVQPQFTLSPIEMVMTEEQIMVWDDTRTKVLQTQNQKRHRASFDAYVIQQTWLESYRLSRCATAQSTLQNQSRNQMTAGRS